MPPSICYICAFACHPRLFASKDEAAIVSQSIGDGRRDRACLGYGMAVGKVTGHGVISIRLGEQGGRANAACISLRSPSFPFIFSLFLLGRAALAGPPAIPILSACLVRASRSPSSFRTEQRSSSPVSSSFPDQYRSQSQLHFSKPFIYKPTPIFTAQWETWCGTNTLATSPSRPPFVSSRGNARVLVPADTNHVLSLIKTRFGLRSLESTTGSSSGTSYMASSVLPVVFSECSCSHDFEPCCIPGAQRAMRQSCVKLHQSGPVQCGYCVA